MPRKFGGFFSAYFGAKMRLAFNDRAVGPAERRVRAADGLRAEVVRARGDWRDVVRQGCGGASHGTV
jgi:hypothetical protein